MGLTRDMGTAHITFRRPDGSVRTWPVACVLGTTEDNYREWVARWQPDCAFVSVRVTPDPPRGIVSAYECRVCGLESHYASFGGPGVCPACDCGMFRDGSKWTFREMLMTNAQATSWEHDEFRRRAKEHCG